MRVARNAGFTLIEVMIAAALVSVVIIAAIQVLLDQERLFRQNEDQRSADESARLATDVLTQAIASAGFGIDPNLAIDFQYYKCAGDTDPSAKVVTSNCQAATRESTTAPDELVLYSRNPNYRVSLTGGPSAGYVWHTNAVTAAQLTLASNAANFSFPKGQILEVACSGGQTYTYVTVDSTTSNGATNISLEAAPAPPDPFHQQTVLPSNPCFATGAYVFLVDRKRFFVAPYAGHPYLMLDTGTDLNGDGTLDARDATPVAANIEDLQVAYEMNPPSTGTPLDGAAGDSVLFDAAGESALIPQDGNLTTPCSDMTVPYYADRCFYERTSTDPLRYINNPANVVSVHVGLIARSNRVDLGLARAQLNGTLPALFDRPAVDLITSNYNNEYPSVGAANYGYRRSTMRFAVGTPNLASRGLFLW